MGESQLFNCIEIRSFGLSKVIKKRVNLIGRRQYNSQENVEKKNLRYERLG